MKMQFFCPNHRRWEEDVDNVNQEVTFVNTDDAFGPHIILEDESGHKVMFQFDSAEMYMMGQWLASMPLKPLKAN